MYLPFSVSPSGTQNLNILLRILQTRKTVLPCPFSELGSVATVLHPDSAHPCKGLLLHLHQCCPLPTPSCLKAMADAAKLNISKVTQDKAAEFPHPVNMHLYSCRCHLQIFYEVSNFNHITSSIENKSLSWRGPQDCCTCLSISGTKQNNLVTSVTFLIVIKMCDIHQKPTQSLGNKTFNF